ALRAVELRPDKRERDECGGLNGRLRAPSSPRRSTQPPRWRAGAGREARGATGGGSGRRRASGRNRSAGGGPGELGGQSGPMLTRRLASASGSAKRSEI